MPGYASVPTTCWQQFERKSTFLLAYKSIPASMCSAGVRGHLDVRGPKACNFVMAVGAKEGLLVCRRGTCSAGAGEHLREALGLEVCCISV
jgi:hypothetical protein